MQRIVEPNGMYISTDLSRCRFLAPLLAAVAVSGCVQAARIDDDRLAQAGFTKVDPTMTSWTTIPQPLPPHRFVHSTANGVTVVYYADPVACKCVHVGKEDALKNFAVVEDGDTTKFDEDVSTADFLQN